MDDNIIREKAYSFALNVVRLHKRRKNCETGRVMFSQLLRCGTSVGANVEEAQGAQSRKDFISKMAIARKEAYEAHYWLRLLRDTGVLAPEEAGPTLNKCLEIRRLLSSIIISAERNS